ncbi:LppU/SCO3897 family protein [Streptomyces sp. NPDC001606]
MSTPPPSHPAYQQNPGPYQQAPGPYQQAPAGYAQPPAAAPVGQPAAPYPHAPGGYGQPPAAVPAPQGAAGYAYNPQAAAAPYPPAPGVGCEVCGAAPAEQVTVRGHQGFIVMMRFLRRQGVFCRTCGTAIFRKMQSDTMAQGWWGPASSLITPITLLINLFTLKKLRNLPEPAGAWRAPLDPGAPVLRRPMGMVGLLPLTGFALFVLLIIIGATAG